MTTQNPSVNVLQIERDIKALWNKAAETRAIDGAVSRVCFSNLIIYTDEVSDEPKITEIITEFVSKHPCRTILILAQPRLADSKLDVSLHTHSVNPAGTAKNVTCEQITLHATGNSVKELASVLQPLLVPDLPIYLWWRGVFLTQKALVEEMLTLTNRFIYDGVSWTDLHYTVPQVAACIEKAKENVAFTNFNWLRLRPWREYAADFFDQGMFEKEVWDLNRVRVEYMSLPGQEEGHQFRSLLFIAWLAVQLEWEAVQGKPGTNLSLIQFKNKKGDYVETELALIPQTSETSQSIQRVVMGVQRADSLQEFIVERDHKEHLMILSYQTAKGRSIFRKVPHTESSVAELLFRELGRRMRNRVFEKSFTTASQLLQLI